MRDLDTEIFVLKFVTFFICMFFLFAIWDINFLYTAIAILVIAFAGALNTICRMKKYIDKLNGENND